ncbi:hypothetical protein [Maridesulfovibrio hydrothermalis]|uniref:Uncharacterized protein n=1 Tax=Maridesulfovibrio hydrothermalis AM13 = DSM 14728 TaxID=1121451 RepID=L0RGX3_9BACT|nr:hypothetical protein [Maridesulfovibrio hydrothermalis]CCO25450.1 exported protein of unknown function [Maridesulfovibrio hydrothermalis AM13 = DSM 14728]
MKISSLQRGIVIGFAAILTAIFATCLIVSLSVTDASLAVWGAGFLSIAVTTIKCNA